MQRNCWSPIENPYEVFIQNLSWGVGWGWGGEGVRRTVAEWKRRREGGEGGECRHKERGFSKLTVDGFIKTHKEVQITFSFNETMQNMCKLSRRTS